MERYLFYLLLLNYFFKDYNHGEDFMKVLGFNYIFLFKVGFCCSTENTYVSHISDSILCQHMYSFNFDVDVKKYHENMGTRVYFTDCLLANYDQAM